MVKDSYFVGKLICLYKWFEVKVKDSFFVGIFELVWGFVSKVVVESFLFKILAKISIFFNDMVKESLIGSFISSNWDKKIKSEKSLFNNKFIVIGSVVGQEFENSNNIITNSIKESFFYKILDENFVLFLLYIIIFLIPLAPTLILVFIAVVTIGIYFVNVMLGRIKIDKTIGIKRMAILFLFCYLISAITSYSLKTGLQITGVILVFAGIFFIATSLFNNSKRLEIAVNILIVSGVIVSLLGIRQYFTGVVMDKAWIDSKEFGDMTRVYATFTNPNVLGEYLIIISSVCIGMLWKSKLPSHKIFYFICFGIATTCLFMTNSRGSMVGLIIAIGIFVLIAEKRLILFGILGLALLPFVLPESIWQRMLSIVTFSDTSSLYRISIYKASLKIIQDFWETGIGVGAFNVVYPIYAYDAAYAYHSHNIFLQVFIELGIVGFSCFATMLVLYVQKLYYGCRNTINSNKYLIGVILGGFVGLMFQGLADYLWFDYRIVLLFWLIFGIGISAVNVNVDEKIIQ